jgi:hypothetical protein
MSFPAPPLTVMRSTWPIPRVTTPESALNRCGAACAIEGKLTSDSNKLSVNISENLILRFMFFSLSNQALMRLSDSSTQNRVKAQLIMSGGKGAAAGAFARMFATFINSIDSVSISRYIVKEGAKMYQRHQCFFFLMIALRLLQA